MSESEWIPTPSGLYWQWQIIPSEPAPEGWCVPDGCPSTICGGPHVSITDADGASVIVPEGSSEANILMAMNYARNMMGKHIEIEPE